MQPTEPDGPTDDAGPADALAARLSLLFGASPLPPSLREDSAASLASLFWAVAVGGAAAATIGLVAVRATGSLFGMAGACLALIGYVIAAMAAWQSGSGPSRWAESSFAVGATLAAAGTGIMVLATLAARPSIELQMLVVMLGLAVIGAANGTATGRPTLVSFQAILIAVPMAVGVGLYWRGWAALAAAVGVLAFAVVSIVIVMRSWETLLALARAREAEQAGRARLAAAMQHLPHAVAVLDGAMVPLTVNGRFLDLFDLERADARPIGELLADSPALAMVGDVREEFVRLSRLLGERRQAFDNVLRLKDQRVVDVEAQPTPDGGWVVVLRDTTGEHATVAALSREARRCPLTGLPNRRAFMERLEARCRQPGAWALLSADLDGFKAINDERGHPVGDRVLTRVGNRLRTAAPDMFVARLGGDEFAMIAELKEGTEAEALARHLRSAVAAPLRLDGDPISVGLAVGIAMAPHHGLEPATLLRAADLALLAAKKPDAGVVVFGASSESAADVQGGFEGRAEAALEHGDIDIQFQPLFDLARGRVVGVEALARWRNDGTAELPSETLASVAEARGLWAQLRNAMLVQAAPVVAALPEPIGLWCRISAFDLRDPRLADDVLALLTRAGLAPHRLVLQVTENALLGQDDAPARGLAPLRNAGVRIAIDDFGSGFSSLTRLRQLPVDHLKLGSALVSGSARDDTAAHILRAAAGLGRSLRLDVVAEGIDTPDDLAEVRAAGINRGQGRHFGPVASASDLVMAIRESEARLVTAVDAEWDI